MTPPPIRPPAVLRWCALVLGAVVAAAPPAARAQANKMTVERNGIRFDSSYDNGSLGGVALAAPGEFDLSLFTEVGEKGSRRYWFRFTAAGVGGRRVVFNIDHSENPRPFIRSLAPAETPWRRMTAAEAPDDQTLVLELGAEHDTVELAFFHPLGYGETRDAVAALVEASPHATRRPLGTSHENRELDVVDVVNPRYADAAKHRVWVHSRAHAGEVTSTHTFLGFLAQVTEDSETGRRLREHCLFQLVPLLNVDGVHRGLTRWDALGIDPESEWCNIRTPAVQAVRDEVDALMGSDNPIEVALNLHSTRGEFADSFFFKHIRPSVTAEFELVQQRFIDAFDDATPLFENQSPAMSQLSTCSFIESYFWNGWRESVMALTHEGHYYRRVTDGGWITGGDYREIGAGLARALVDYFDLPPSSEPDRMFPLWADEQFGAGAGDPAVAGPDADPDKDTLSNRAEYVFGTDPLAFSAPPAVGVDLSPAGARLTFRRAQHLTDVRWLLEHSVDLGSWAAEDFATSPELTVETVVDVGFDDGYFDVVTVTHTAPLADRRQYRLAVEIGP